jgi:hypothetical protein
VLSSALGQHDLKRLLAYHSVPGRPDPDLKVALAIASQAFLRASSMFFETCQNGLGESP